MALGTQYATTTDLANLAAPANALNGVSVAQQNTALEAASRIADDSLSVVYTLPLTTWGTSLTERVCNLALWKLLVAKGAAAGAVGLMYAERAKEAERFFKRIEEGLRPVGIVDSAPSTVDPGGTFSYTSAKRGW